MGWEQLQKKPLVGDKEAFSLLLILKHEGIYSDDAVCVFGV